VRRNSTFTYAPRWSAETKLAPQGNEVLMAAASASERIRMIGTRPLASGPLMNSLGRAK